MTLALIVDPNSPSGYSLARVDAPRSVPGDPRLRQANRQRHVRVGVDPRVDEVDPSPELPPLPGQADPATIPVGTMRGEMTDDGRANAYVWSGFSWELVASNEIVADELIDITIFQSDHNYDIGQVVLYKDTPTSYQMWEAIVDHVLEGAAAPADPDWKLIGGSGGGGGTGTDEVWIGPDAPVDPALELWYDTDAPTPQALRLFASMSQRDTQWPAAVAGNGALCITTDTTREWISNGATWKLIGGSLPRVRAQKLSQQSVQAAAAIQWPQADMYDTDGLHDPAANSGQRIAIPAGLGGIWMFEFSLYIQAVATAAGSECYLYVNGTGQRYGWAKQFSGANEDISLSGSAPIVLAAGDYVEVWGYSSAARLFGHPSLAGYFGAAYMGAS